MIEITCPYAKKYNSFKYLLCEKKMKANGTKVQDMSECFAAMCDAQEPCVCADGVRMKEDAYLCPLAANETAEEEKKTVRASKRSKK